MKEGNGCGAVGRAVASDNRDPRFECKNKGKMAVLEKDGTRKIDKITHRKETEKD